MNTLTNMPFRPDDFEEQIRKLPMDRYMRELERFIKLAKSNPKNAEIQFALGLMYLRTESWGTGLKYLKKAHKLAPKSEDILKTICELLYLQTKNYKDAVHYFKKWSMIRKDLAVLWINMAKCLNNTDRPKDAFEALKKAEAIEPENPELKPTRADVYTKIGDADGAKRELEEAFYQNKDPKMATGLFNLPNYDPDIMELDAILETTKNLKNQSGLNLLYSNLGAAYEKSKAYDKAFECFRLSNVQSTQMLDFEEYINGYKNVREAFTREFLRERTGKGHQSDQPIFIVGMPRSGTTLTESILAGHPEIIDNGELSFMHTKMYSIGLYKRPEALLENSVPNFRKFIQGLSDSQYAAMGKSYIEQDGFKKNDKRYQVDKLPHNFMAVGFIHLIFPNAKIIWCRRNPIDNALSCYKAAFSEFHAYASDLSSLGLYYRQYWELMKYWQDVLPVKMLEIFYEDTVANTELVARKMIDFLGLEWDERCLDHTGSKKTVRTASQWQVRQPIYTSSVAKWKNYENQLQPMIKNMGSIVEQYDAELAALSDK